MFNLKLGMAYNTGLLFHKYLYKHSTNNVKFSYLHKRNLKLVQNFFHSKPTVILGIESSCDDTACGIVDTNGQILGEAISSQHLTHLNLGGIIPSVARVLHRNNITKTCENALRAANLKLRDIDAIATTVKPGLPMSLRVGTQFGKYLAQIGKKPLIPIHHMEAHALTARMNREIDFPYLILLVSGAHCLLAIVDNVNKFYLLGTSVNNAPGEMFDKVARRLKLKNIPEFSTLNGGLAIEIAANKASNIEQFLFPPVMTKYPLQLATVTHICHRTQRAMEFVNKMSLFPKHKRTLVVSGGVACNNFLAKALNIVSTELGYSFIRTPPKLCTDNGTMIAWNGIEKWIADVDIIRNPNEIEKIEIEKTAPLGENWIQKVEAANLKCKWVKIKKKLF
ncbi:probable tRNA N6-adenosine threonylcarbamoyltransferase, mitochondrial isoform X3 [Bombus pyrosoma]|uniref:probable tRNA N6-adenosine threonylcarbamoyltransferase, mitochondrial isoform X3 n=1 Tax=Bombus pyrosoma TaxID=396416 RepID=UPI001CB8AAF5|nr:probable tRNA N6-adenosine threonylcarbamoyltransferase, mitochondrial isoform X3 [Bombus pyrosoma]